MKLFFQTFIILSLIGCHKPLTTPEELDPIYKEWLADYENTEKKIEEQKKIIEEFPEKFEHIVPQTGQTRKIYKEYYQAKNQLDALKQKALYYELAAKSRKYEARKLYLEAFEAEKEWPDPKEYEEFKLNKQVQSVNLSWRQRYPAEVNRHKKKTKREELREKEKKKAEASSEHH